MTNNNNNLERIRFFGARIGYKIRSLNSLLTLIGINDEGEDTTPNVLAIGTDDGYNEPYSLGLDTCQLICKPISKMTMPEQVKMLEIVDLKDDDINQTVKLSDWLITHGYVTDTDFERYGCVE